MSGQIINPVGVYNIHNTQQQKEKFGDLSDMQPLIKFDWPPAPEAPRKVKVGVFLTTLAGVGLAMANVMKGKGFSLNARNMFKTNPKDWAIFHIKYKKEGSEIEHLVMKLAAGSLIGGLLGGALFDKKENMKAKYRETVIQAIGNIATPLICVSFGVRAFDKYLNDRIVKILPKLKNAKHNKILEGIPGVIASGLCLLTGIIGGNKVGNFINQKAFSIDDKRKLKLSDMSPHIDDLCLATTLVVPPESSVGPFISRIIPVALLVAGNNAGTAQETPHRVAQQKLKEFK